MAIRAGTCESYLRDIIVGLHQPSDTYKIAIYDKDATLSSATQAYTSAHEVVGKGYPAGGVELTGFGRTTKGAGLCFHDACVPKATITGRGALIYNATKGNRAIVVLDFGQDIVSTQAPFEIEFPAAVLMLAAG